MEEILGRENRINTEIDTKKIHTIFKEFLNPNT